MRTALISTTINVPRVLALYRKLGPDVAFFIAADEKTPLEAYAFCADIPNCEIYSPDRQKELGYECSALIGWNNDSRRNIALLEAVKDGAEIIVSVDDDMIGMGDFFGTIDRVFSNTYSGIQMGAPQKWFDAGQLTFAPAPQRGLPVDFAHDNSFSLITDVHIGAMQCVILGIPDTDAATAISRHPLVLEASDVLRHGVVAHPEAFSVFNSQATVFRREFAPCFAQFYKWEGRNTDIFASLIMRRVMRDWGAYTYFGLPAAFHARTKRDLLADFKAEQWGLERVGRFAKFLDACILPHEKVVNNLRLIYRAMGEDAMLDLAACALAFLDDMEKVL